MGQKLVYKGKDYYDEEAIQIIHDKAKEIIKKKFKERLYQEELSFTAMNGNSFEGLDTETIEQIIEELL